MPSATYKKCWRPARATASSSFCRRAETPRNSYLGGCGLNQIDAINRRANLGYWVRFSATRRGIATRAVQQLRDWAFANTDLVRLEMVIAVNNVASRRAAEKSGAVFEAILRSRLLIAGAPHDAFIFSFIRPA